MTDNTGIPGARNTDSPSSGTLMPDEPVDRALTEGHVALPADLRDKILGAVQVDTPPLPRTHHLAQMNIARFHQPMDHPHMAAFVEMLDPINHQADAAPGFVWRLTDEGSNNATSIAFYEDPLLLVNMSVWEDVEALRNYVYRTEHVGMVRRRAEWADAMESNYIVLWWVPAGHTPDLAEGDTKLKLLQANGPTVAAFTFGQSFPAPAA